MTDKLITHEEAYTRLVFGDKVIWHEKQFLEDYITQQEQRDKDVARFFELENKHCELHEIDEFYELREKLSKVGNKL